MAHRIQNRRDILSNWNAVNPVLADGEIGFIKDTNELVIGNGIDTFSNLSRISLVVANRVYDTYDQMTRDLMPSYFYWNYNDPSTTLTTWEGLV
jgi:hypothetical protein